MNLIENFSWQLISFCCCHVFFTIHDMPEKAYHQNLEKDGIHKSIHSPEFVCWKDAFAENSMLSLSVSRTRIIDNSLIKGIHVLKMDKIPSEKTVYHIELNAVQQIETIHDDSISIVQLIKNGCNTVFWTTFFQSPSELLRIYIREPTKRTHTTCFILEFRGRHPSKSSGC